MPKMNVERRHEKAPWSYRSIITDNVYAQDSMKLDFAHMLSPIKILFPFRSF